MSKRKYSSCLLGCLMYSGIAALVLAVPVWYFCIYAPPLVISEATTRITGPLTADGQVDYFKALKERVYQYPPEFATDENGYRIFVRQFGYISRSRVGDIDPTIGGYFWLGTPPDQHEIERLQIYEQLELDPDIPTTTLLPHEPLRVFVDYYEAKGEELPESAVTTDGCCGLVTYTVQGESWTRPWTLEQFPMFADWLDEIDAPMDAIAEAVRKPVFFVPYESRYYVCPFNTAGKILQARANYRIAHGDIDGAIDDTLTIIRMGRLVTQRACVMLYSTGIGIEWMGMTVPVGANPENPLTKEQVQRLLAGLDALPPRGSLTYPYEWERLGALSHLQTFMRDPSIDSMLISFPATDWNVVFRRVNELYDIVQDPALRTKAGYDSLRDMGIKLHPSGGFLAFFSRMLTPGGRGVNFANMFISMQVSHVSSFEWALRRLECSENMQRLAWAIQLYQLETGEMSDENWATQIEKYLAGTPAAGVPAKYFSCPSNPAAKGETVYALVRYDEALSADIDAILLVELSMPVPLDKAVVSVDEALELVQRREDRWHHWQHAPHTQALNVAYRSGAVRWLNAIPKGMGEKELHRALGRE